MNIQEVLLALLWFCEEDRFSEKWTTCKWFSLHAWIPLLHCGRPPRCPALSIQPSLSFFRVLSGFGFILLTFVWLWFFSSEFSMAMIFFFDVLSGWQNLVADFAACKFWHLCHISYKLDQVYCAWLYYLVQSQYRAFMPVYIGKMGIWSGDTNAWHLTQRQQNIGLLSLSKV